MYNHYKRIESRSKNDEVELSKSNILLAGPTGSGKTLLAETLARLLNVPFTIADATTLTEAGYVGEDVENIIQKLLQKCDYDVEKAQSGHCLHRRDRQDLAQEREPVDHPRRVGRRRAAGAAEADRGHRGLVCRRRAAASIRSRNSCRWTPRTSCSSAAARSPAWTRSSSSAAPKPAALVSAPRSSLSERKAEIGKVLSEVEPEDLIKFGLIPEFVGRLPVVATLEELDEPALVKILTEPKNAITKQFKKLFEMEGVELEFRPDALAAIARKRAEAQDRRPRPAHHHGIGAARHHVRPAVAGKRQQGRGGRVGDRTTNPSPYLIYQNVPVQPKAASGD